MVALERLNIKNNTPEWLTFRNTGIGGSDAGTIMGLITWKTSYELWEEKTGRKQPKDLSENLAVKYGINAEDYLFKLFALDYPEYDVLSTKDFVFKRGFAFASLDGELIEKETGRKGFLEIKTTEIRSAVAEKKWTDDTIPYNYYCQILHYFMVLQYDFCILKAQIKYRDKNGQVLLKTKHYKYERKDLNKEIELLFKKEYEFWQCVKNNTPPTIIIPQIH